jgi:hypothetical protein
LHRWEAKKKGRSATVFVAITSRDHSKAKGVTNKVQDKKETKRNEAITIEKTNKESKENKMDRK